MKNNTQRLTLFTSVFALLCASRTFAAPRARPGFASGGFGPIHEILIPTDGGREPIDDANRPSRLHPDLKGSLLRIEGNPTSGETSRGVFASSWWPMKDNGIAARWASPVKDYEDRETDPDDLSPTEKYDLLFYPGQAQRLPEVRSYTTDELNRPEGSRGNGVLRPSIVVAGPTTAWELQNHGTQQSTVPENWWGHCNGWSSYVTAEREGAPMRDVRVRRDGNRLVECRADDAGCVLFHMADLEALFSEVYFHDAATTAGRRCNVEESKIARDVDGRPLDPACRDLNPGSLHVALVGLLGRGAVSLANTNGPRERLPFGVDYSAGDEVWTFPVVKYAIRSMVEVDEARATDLVCHGDGPVAGCRSYKWNENATRFARVQTSFWVMNYATSPEVLRQPPLSRDRPLAETTLHYVLELDGRGTILGGEWINSPTGAGPNSKKLHPDFMFMAVFADASDEGSDDRGGSGDNPYLSYPNIQAILRIARSPANGNGR